MNDISLEEAVSRTIVTNTQPPQWILDRAIEVFDLPKNCFEEHIVFTYGDTVYSSKPMDKALFLHEATHVMQQNNFEGGPDNWWNVYFTDTEFRLAQELEAYRIQYNFAANHLIKDRNSLFKYLFDLAGTLSGPMYGHIVSRQEAMKLIRSMV